MTRLLSRVNLFSALKISVRYKQPAHHWSVLKKKKPSTRKALEHFDDFYNSIYGPSWPHIRLALLAKNHKYVAIVNNYSDTERICHELETLGAMNLKVVYDNFKKFLKRQRELKESDDISKDISETTNDFFLVDEQPNLKQIVSEKKFEQSVYPNPTEDHLDEELSFNDNKNSMQPVTLESIEVNTQVVTDNNRVIKSASHFSASQLYEFVPATKLKGLDDFVGESEYYGHYNKASDFFVQIEAEQDLNFPENLLIYAFEEGNHTKFPKPKSSITSVLDYFVMDGGSVLPVLSLDLQPGDKILDMCAAPGGKSLMMLQSLCPRLLVANDLMESRINRINTVFNEYLPDMDDSKSRLIVTQNDARYIDDQDIYNKILVDVPCTTDRLVLHEDDNNWFKTSRIKERLKLPELQTEILKNALRLIVPGGTVVYSTCTLSPIQNDGVVHVALKQTFEEYQHVFVVKDQTEALDPLQYMYNFGTFGLKYGHIVVPSKSKNWGPMYFCKMVRVQ